MLANVQEQLHIVARQEAESLVAPNRKQLRFNEIVQTALDFYPSSPEQGVRELVRACDRLNGAYAGFIGPVRPNKLYDTTPMWRVLREQYAWMLSD